VSVGRRMRPWRGRPDQSSFSPDVSSRAIRSSGKSSFMDCITVTRNDPYIPHGVLGLDRGACFEVVGELSKGLHDPLAPRRNSMNGFVQSPVMLILVHSM